MIPPTYYTSLQESGTTTYWRENNETIGKYRHPPQPADAV